MIGRCGDRSKTRRALAIAVIHLDVARNFHSAETVKRLLEVASFYKLNRFHFHLTDDEGWRLAIAELPELTEVGGRRGHTEDESEHLIPSYGSGPDPDGSHGSGSYSRVQMVRDAAVRSRPPYSGSSRDRSAGARPGGNQGDGCPRSPVWKPKVRRRKRSDSGSSIHRMPPNIDRFRAGTTTSSTSAASRPTRFIETVIDEIVEIWAEAEAPLEAVHIGGDEVPAGVWTASPSCEQLIAEALTSMGQTTCSGISCAGSNAMLSERGLVTARLGGDRSGRKGVRWQSRQGAGSEPGRVGPSSLRLEQRLGLGRRGPWVPVGKRWLSRSCSVVRRISTSISPTQQIRGDRLHLGRNRRHPQAVGVRPLRHLQERRDSTCMARRSTRHASPAACDRRPRAARGYSASRDNSGPRTPRAATSWSTRRFQSSWDWPSEPGRAQPEWARTNDTAERRRQEALAWTEFANRLGQRELRRLDSLVGGVSYRLPPPGAAIRNGLLTANTAFPGLAVRYTTDGSEPTASSSLYTEPVPVAGPVRLKTFDTRGRGGRLAALE